MKLNTILKGVLGLLVLGLIITATSWFFSAKAEDAAAAGEWILVTGELNDGNAVLYMFNTEKQVLLVYAYHRGRRGGAGGGRNTFNGDLEFLAGRLCRWDMLYSTLIPYPYSRTNTPPSGMHTPEEMKKAFEKASAGVEAAVDNN